MGACSNRHHAPVVNAVLFGQAVVWAKPAVSRLEYERFGVQRASSMVTVAPQLHDLTFGSKIATATVDRSDGKSANVTFRQTPQGWILTLANEVHNPREHVERGAAADEHVEVEVAVAPLAPHHCTALRRPAHVLSMPHRCYRKLRFRKHSARW